MMHGLFARVIVLLSLLRFKANLKKLPSKTKRAYDQRVCDRKKKLPKMLPIYVRDKLARHHAYRKLVIPYVWQQNQLNREKQDTAHKASSVPATMQTSKDPLPIIISTILLKIIEWAIYLMICLATSTALGIALSREIPAQAWDSDIGKFLSKAVGITSEGLGLFIGITAEAAAIFLFDVALNMLCETKIKNYLPKDLKLFFRGIAALVFSCSITLVGVTKTHELSKNNTSNIKDQYNEKYSEWEKKHIEWEKGQAKLKEDQEKARSDLPIARGDYLLLRWPKVDVTLREKCEAGEKFDCPEPLSGPRTSAAHSRIQQLTAITETKLGEGAPEKPGKQEMPPSESYNLLVLWAGIALCKIMRIIILQVYK